MKLLQQRRRREQEIQAEEEKYRNKLLRGEREAMEEADRMRALRFLSGNASRDEDEDDDDVGLAPYEEEPVYQLMRGPDGRIYRVQVGVKQVPVVKPKSMSQNIRPLENEDHSMRQAFRESMDDVVVTEHNLEPTNRPTSKVPPPIRSLSSPSLGAPNEMKTIKSSSRTPPKSKKNSTAKKTRIQVIVEDASDSETEDEFYNSPWRNRRPSPGAWIEPVEYFQDLQR
jgi:hypothetical protein